MFLPLPPLLSLSLSLCTLFLPLLFLAFVFGRGRLCRCRVFGEADCFLPLLRRITSSTWASWGCSEQLVSSSCSGRERPSESCCGPSSSPSRYSAGNRYTHNVRMVTIHVPALTYTPSSPLTGSAVCVPAHCHALLHLCHHRHAGECRPSTHVWLFYMMRRINRTAETVSRFSLQWKKHSQPSARYHNVKIADKSPLFKYKVKV